jgi:hypothetical protein
LLRFSNNAALRLFRAGLRDGTPMRGGTRFRIAGRGTIFRMALCRNRKAGGVAASGGRPPASRTDGYSISINGRSNVRRHGASTRPSTLDQTRDARADESVGRRALRGRERPRVIAP